MPIYLGGSTIKAVQSLLQFTVADTTFAQAWAVLNQIISIG